MASTRRSNAMRLLFVFSPAIWAQTTTSSPEQTTSPATTTTSPTTLTPESSFYPSISSFSASARPSSNDSAPDGNHNNPLNSSSLVQYYFVFLALLVCCLALAIFFVFRRRSRSRAARRMGSSRESGPGRDLDGSGGRLGGDSTTRRRRYRQGRWEEIGREEGLNEEGEAPPPYLPKRQSQEQPRTAETSYNEPAIPMHTLSRDDVGLKPPDYSEAGTYAAEASMRNSVASASSSRTLERPTDS